MKITRTVITIFLGLLLSLGVLSCGDDDGPDNGDADIEIAGTWTGTLSGTVLTATVSNTTFTVDAKVSALKQAADVAEYSNAKDYLIALWTTHPTWKGKYTKLGWTLSGSSITITPYKSHDDLAGARDETAVDTQGKVVTLAKK